MGKGKKIPDRWLDYSTIGKEVPRTKFIAFKVPLKQQTCQNHLEENQWFTPASLLQEVPNLKLIVNLTNTNDGRYYFNEDFQKNGVKVLSFPCEGRGSIPPLRIMHMFYSAVDNFMSRAASTGEDSLIGVHCTHGLNRTGYFICKYMVERLGMPANTAIELFEDARGHKMERLPYINDIKCSKFIENFTAISVHSTQKSMRNTIQLKKRDKCKVSQSHSQQGRYNCMESSGHGNDGNFETHQTKRCKILPDLKTIQEDFNVLKFSETKPSEYFRRIGCNKVAALGKKSDEGGVKRDNWREGPRDNQCFRYSRGRGKFSPTVVPARQTPSASTSTQNTKTNNYYSPLNDAYEETDANATYRSRYQKKKPRR